MFTTRSRSRFRRTARATVQCALAFAITGVGVQFGAHGASASADHTFEYSPDSNGVPSELSFSRDGRYLMFMSNADDIVAGHVYRQPYIVDRQTGDITAAIHGPADSPVGSDTNLATMSGDGNVIAFVTGASIIDGDTDHQELYLYNRSTGATVDITRHDDQTQLLGTQSITTNEDGSAVAFDSADSQLIPGLSDGYHLFLYRNGAIEQIDNNSLAPSCVFNTQDYKVVVSDSGRYVAFTRRDCGLVPGDTNGQLDVFWKDMDTGVIKKVSTPVGGGQSDGQSDQPSISADGRYVTFTSQATNLMPGEALVSPASHVYRYDTSTDTLTDVVDDGSIDRVFSGYGEQSAISPNGRYVAFYGTGLTFTPLRPSLDVVFLRDTLTGRIELASVTDNGTLDNGQHASDTAPPPADPPVVLDDGTVAFISDAQLVSEADGLPDVFVREQGPPATQPATATLTVGTSSLNPYSTVPLAAVVSAPDAQIRQYVFDFGDGSQSDPFTLPAASPDEYHETVTHYYASPGTYTATVSATDDEGRIITASTDVTITPATPPNQPPIASLTVTPASGVAPVAMQFAASGSNDPDGSISDYAFDFNDGSAIVHSAIPTVSHTYATAGSYQPSVTVTDNDGATAVATQSVSVSAPPITSVKGSFRATGATGKGFAIVGFSVTRQKKTGAYKGHVTFTDTKAHVHAVCTVIPNGVQRLGYANGAVLTANCVGAGPQKGEAGPGSITLFDNSAFGATDAVSLYVGGTLNDSLSQSAVKSTANVLAVDLEGGAGGGHD